MSTPHERPANSPPAYEERDVALRPIVGAAIALVVLVTVTSGLMWIVQHRLNADLARESPPVSPLAATYARHEPPPPRLQKDPRADLLALHAREQALLDSYAWIDRAQGRVRIPVARAAELLAQESAR